MNFPEEHRWKNAPGNYASEPGNPFGCFRVVGPGGRWLFIIACDGEETGWEHVSVTTEHKGKCATWPEMAFVKALFWSAEEAVMQLHPPQSEYVNNHDSCLHLWRPTQASIPLPPSILVGIKSMGVIHR